MKNIFQQRFYKAIIIELVLILAVVVGIGYYYVSIHLDARDNAPVISIDETDNTFSVKDSEEALLKGVSASDEEDGIVTDSMIIESISPFVGKNTRIVTYAAFDSHNNVTKAEREIHYSDYKPPTFTSKKYITVEKGDYAEILSYLSAKDVIDGDISDKIKLEVNNVVKGVPGDYAVQITVTNSCGDVSTQDIVVTVTGGATR